MIIFTTTRSDSRLSVSNLLKTNSDLIKRAERITTGLDFFILRPAAQNNARLLEHVQYNRCLSDLHGA